ncbi:ATP-binding protein [Kitasatospora sp. NPDC091207]|uniref:ATP-binding protein n=1 Tax=Kitasatospora sp. NPDC091207 TaxID=3364083 RepID=UPI003814B9C6
MPEPLDSTPSDQLCSLPRHPSSASAARIVLRGFLSDLKDGERYAEAADLIVTELVAHTVRRPRVPEHLLIDVLFEYAVPSGLRIEVHDIGRADPGRRPRGGAEAGTGLGLVREFCSAWGEQVSEGELTTSLVWAQLDPPPGPAA